MIPLSSATTSKPCAPATPTAGSTVTTELEQLAGFEAHRRRLIPQLESLKREQNTASDEVARAKRQGLDARPIFEANKARNQKIKQLEIELESVESQRNRLMTGLPNMPHATVPVGKTAADNVVVRTWGEPRSFDFEPLAHWDLGPQLGIIDFERATKIARARFAVLLGAGAQLERALINFMLDAAHGPSTATPRCSRRSWSTAPPCSAPASCRSSSRTCSRSAATGTST